jgi:molybdenum cofactor guanylyltransferase
VKAVRFFLVMVPAMDKFPTTIYCSGVQEEGKQRMLAVLVQALTQRGMRVGVLRYGIERPDGPGDSYIAAGAAAHVDMRTGIVALACTEESPDCLGQRLFADCHVMLVDCVCHDGLPGTVLEIRDACFCGFGRMCADADEAAKLIRTTILRPLVSAAVLAGGRSRRLGRNKALLPLNGTTVIESVIGEARSCVAAVTLITNSPDEYAHLGYPCKPDLLPGGGPLSGIHAALSQCGTEYVLVVSCDIPLITRALFEQLIAALPGQDIVIFKHAHFEPLCALYRRTCIPALEELIAHGEYRIIDLFPTLRVKVLRTASAELFRSINTDADYASVMHATSAVQRDPCTAAAADGKP